MIDWNRIEELRSEIGEEDFGEVVELFLEEVEEVIERLRLSVDLPSLEADLHFLKGSALNLGFKSFSQLCQAGETAASKMQFDTVDVGQIISSYDASKIDFLTQLKAQNAA